MYTYDESGQFPRLNYEKSTFNGDAGTYAETGHIDLLLKVAEGASPIAPYFNTFDPQQRIQLFNAYPKIEGKVNEEWYKIEKASHGYNFVVFDESMTPSPTLVYTYRLDGSFIEFDKDLSTATQTTNLERTGAYANMLLMAMQMEQGIIDDSAHPTAPPPSLRPRRDNHTDGPSSLTKEKRNSLFKYFTGK